MSPYPTPEVREIQQSRSLLTQQISNQTAESKIAKSSELKQRGCHVNAIQSYVLFVKLNVRNSFHNSRLVKVNQTYNKMKKEENYDNIFSKQLVSWHNKTTYFHILMKVFLQYGPNTLYKRLSMESLPPPWKALVQRPQWPHHSTQLVWRNRFVQEIVGNSPFQLTHQTGCSS